MLMEVHISYNETVKTILNNHSPSGYIIQTIKKDLIQRVCPKCNEDTVSEIEVTQDNFYLICKLLKEHKIKDAWETLFDILL